MFLSSHLPGRLPALLLQLGHRHRGRPGRERSGRPGGQHQVGYPVHPSTVGQGGPAATEVDGGHPTADEGGAEGGGQRDGGLLGVVCKGRGKDMLLLLLSLLLLLFLSLLLLLPLSVLLLSVLLLSLLLLSLLLLSLLFL